MSDIVNVSRFVVWIAVGMTLLVSCELTEDVENLRKIPITRQEQAWFATGTSSTSSWQILSSSTLGGGVSVSYSEPDPNGGEGSIYFNYNDSSGFELTGLETFASDVVIEAEGFNVRQNGFGYLTDLERLSFHWYRSSVSNVRPALVPAMRIFVMDGPDVYALIWEAIYNQVRVAPDNIWVLSDITEDFFWRSPVYVDGDYLTVYDCRETRYDCYQYRRTLADWGFGANAKIIGLNIQVGSGWRGRFNGYVDLVELLVGGEAFFWDFEPIENQQ